MERCAADFCFQPGQARSGRPPEPLFFRGNTGDIIEYWHTNLVPNYYLVDDFQVRTPTDILGQHIHLVKFDVTSSDGAGNGFNYEDGTFSPQEVQDTIRAIKADGGLLVSRREADAARTAKAPPSDIFSCSADPTDPRCQPCPDNWTPNFPPAMPELAGCADDDSALVPRSVARQFKCRPDVADGFHARSLRTIHASTGRALRRPAG